MTDKPYSEPLGGSYVVDKPGGKPVRVAFTEHRNHGAPTEAELAAETESGVLIVKPETAFGDAPVTGFATLVPSDDEPPAAVLDKSRKGK